MLLLLDKIYTPCTCCCFLIINNSYNNNNNYYYGNIGAKVLQKACRWKRGMTESRLTGDILLALDSGNLAMLSLLDLSAAFDTVDHE